MHIDMSWILYFGIRSQLFDWQNLPAISTRKICSYSQYLLRVFRVHESSWPIQSWTNFHCDVSLCQVWNCSNLLWVSQQRTDMQLKPGFWSRTMQQWSVAVRFVLTNFEKLLSLTRHYAVNILPLTTQKSTELRAKLLAALLLSTRSS